MDERRQEPDRDRAEGEPIPDERAPVPPDGPTLELGGDTAAAAAPDEPGQAAAPAPPPSPPPPPLPSPPPPGYQQGALPPGPGMPPGPAGPVGPPGARRLVRPVHGRVLGGVAAGLGNYLGVDPRVLRVVFVLLTLFGGAGLVMYIAGLVAIPREDRAEAPAEGWLRSLRQAPTWVQVLLVVLVVLLFAGAGGGDGGTLLLDTTLLVVGILLFRQDTRAQLAGSAPAGQLYQGQPGQPGQPAVPPPPPPGGAGPADAPGAAGVAPGPGIAGAAGGSWAPAQAQAPAPAAGPAEATTDVMGSAPPAGGWATQQLPPAPPGGGGGGDRPLAEWQQPPPPRPPRPRSMLGRVTFGALLLAAGGAAVLDGVGLVDMGAREYLALALTVIGAGLVVGAWVGRARWLIAVGLVLLPALLVAGLVQDSLRDNGPIDRVERPFTLAQVRPEYRQAAGQLTVDLSGVTFTQDTTEVDASLGVGQLVVVVPEDVTVSVDAQVGAGSADLLGSGFGDERRSDPDQNGPGVDETVTSTGSPDGGRLQLDLRTGLGEIVVRREP